MKKSSLSQFNTDVNRLVNQHNEKFESKLSKTKARELLAKQYGYINYNHYLKVGQKEPKTPSNQINNLKLILRHYPSLSLLQCDYLKDIIQGNISKENIRVVEVDLGLPLDHLFGFYSSFNDMMKFKLEMVNRVPAGYTIDDFESANFYALGIKEGCEWFQDIDTEIGCFTIGKSDKSDIRLGDAIIAWRKGALKKTAIIGFYLNHRNMIGMNSPEGNDLIEINNKKLVYRKLFMVRGAITDWDGTSSYIIHNWTSLAKPNSTPAHDPSIFDPRVDLSPLGAWKQTTPMDDEYDDENSDSSYQLSDYEYSELLKIGCNPYDAAPYLEYIDDLALAAYWAVKD